MTKPTPRTRRPRGANRQQVESQTAAIALAISKLAQTIESMPVDAMSAEDADKAFAFLVNRVALTRRQVVDARKAGTSLSGFSLDMVITDEVPLTPMPTRPAGMISGGIRSGAARITISGEELVRPLLRTPVQAFDPPPPPDTDTDIGFIEE